MSVLDTEAYGDPASCTRAAGQCGTVRTALQEAGSEVDRARSLAGSWHGLAGAAFEGQASDTARDLHELGTRVQTLEHALTDFAGELTVVQSRLAHARQVAAAGGVSVAGTQITRPAPPDATSQGEVDAFNRRAAAWNEAVEIVDGARAKEREAHQNLADGITASTGDGWLADLMQRLGFLPPDFADGVDLGGYAFGLGGLAFGATASILVNGRYGVFQPRTGGRFGSPRGLSFWQRLDAGRRGSSFHARPGMAAERGAWAKAGKFGGYAGGAVTALTAGWDQWQSDADDPSLSDLDRGTRAVTKGVSTGAAAWAGGEAGAWAGGAIGTAICPGVGTVVGGVVGGVIGGAVGAFAGSELGDWAMDGATDVVDATADFLGDAGSAVGDVASDVGDALTFWD
ncbi:hypothetical protein [Nocardioides panaciterrulae]|uniref:Uncharacterized protein YukE n=1 Tax=Nocardioides panaciterrulae TaxID=661492 RepID=A0A7Y9E3S5_9ACTN|nr:hypothetical protein [Nocardioides panaciterrulae]NYD40530.1 uncharacterized protein YukE [Nocardioides panaciterrulae]